MHNALRADKCLLHHEVPYARGMESPADRLRVARERAGYESAKDAALAMGVPVATYIQHENGTRGLPATRAEKYGRFFRITPEHLLYGKASAKPTSPGLGPILHIKGAVVAGKWREAEHWDESEWVTFTGSPDVIAPLRDRFGVRVEGDSMNEIYPEGTVLECVRYWGRGDISTGRRVIVQRKKRDGGFETTVKQYVIDADGVEWLVPRSTNPAHQAFRCDQPTDDIDRTDVIAIVVASIRYEG